jgi:type VI secretion system protein ImpL
VGGPAITRVLVRSSGTPLNEGVEGIFTYKGFNEVFLGEALGVAKRIQSESWVLGSYGNMEQSEVALLAISRDVLDLYYSDFIQRYEAILGDVNIIPMDSLAHAVEVTNILSGPTSPIVNLLNAIAEETRLTEDRSAIPTEGLSEGASAVAQLEFRSLLSLEARAFVTALQAASTDGVPPKAPGVAVEERFLWLHDLVARRDGLPSQLDELVVILNEVYREMSKLSFSGVASTSGDPENSALFQLTQATARLPGPMQRWTTQIASGSSGITAEGARAQVNGKWAAEVLPFCEQALDNRFPFNRRAAAEVGMADFTRLFAPGGLLDTFFTQNLERYVDTSTRPWTYKKVNGADLGMSEASLVAFQMASEIRSAFFPAGPQPSVPFQVTPEAIDPKAKSVTLEIDGTPVVFTDRDKQPAPVAVNWPGPAGMARVFFEPEARDVENTLRRDGPWGWMRLLGTATIRDTNVPERKRVIFNVGGRIAIFQVQTGSSLNPFALDMSKFSCPKSF